MISVNANLTISKSNGLVSMTEVNVLRNQNQVK